MSEIKKSVMDTLIKMETANPFEELLDEAFPPHVSSKILGPPIGITDILNVATEEKLAKEALAGRTKYPIRPSSAGKCERELAYELDEFHNGTKYDKEILTAEKSRIFSLGHSVEWNLFSQMRDMDMFKIEYKQQVVFIKRWNNGRLLEGSIDGAIVNDQLKAIIDSKSKKDKFSAFYASNWDEDDEKLSSLKSLTKLSDTAYYADDLEAFIVELNNAFLEANFVQVNLYLHSDFAETKELDCGILLYYNKNDSRLREIRFRKNKTVFDWTIEKFEGAIEAVEVNKDPTTARRTYMLGSMKCGFCDFKKNCWEKDDALKAFFRTLPKKYWPTDTHKLGDVGEDLEVLFAKLEDSQKLMRETEQLEQDIADLMIANNVRKVRLADNRVYETKQLKDRIKLNRSKT